MITFKGTDKDMKCHGGFQYELGKTYTDDGAIRCGYKGFHSTEASLDVFTYFSPADGSRYFSCIADGTIDKSDEDTKISSSELTLKTEIGLAGLIKAQIEYIFKSSKKEVVTKEKENAAAQGDRGHAAAQGDRGHAAAQGYRGHAAAQGDCGHAEVHGENSIAVSSGIEGTASAEKIGSWIVLAEYSDGKLKEVRTALVDGEKIKPNVRYKLVNGEFVVA